VWWRQLSGCSSPQLPGPIVVLLVAALAVGLSVALCSAAQPPGRGWLSAAILGR